MHEASIAQGILDIAIENCKREGYASIRSVTVRIGKAVNIFPEALRFAFDAGKEGTIACNAELIIEEVPVIARCGGCNSEFEIMDLYAERCPKCGAPSFIIISGSEMELQELDVE